MNSTETRLPACPRWRMMYAAVNALTPFDAAVSANGQTCAAEVFSLLYCGAAGGAAAGEAPLSATRYLDAQRRGRQDKRRPARRVSTGI